METTTTLKTVSKTTVNEVEISFEYERAEGQMPTKIGVRGVRNAQTETGPKVAVINADYVVATGLLNFSGSNFELTDTPVITAVMDGIATLVTNLENEAAV